MEQKILFRYDGAKMVLICDNNIDLSELINKLLKIASKEREIKKKREELNEKKK